MAVSSLIVIKNIGGAGRYVTGQRSQHFKLWWISNFKEVAA